MAQYQDTYDLRVNLDVVPESLGAVEKIWKDEHTLNLHLNKEFKDFYDRIKTGLSTNLNVEISPGSLDRLRNISFSNLLAPAQAAANQFGKELESDEAYLSKLLAKVDEYKKKLSDSKIQDVQRRAENQMDSGVHSRDFDTYFENNEKSFRELYNTLVNIYEIESKIQEINKKYDPTVLLGDIDNYKELLYSQGFEDSDFDIKVNIPERQEINQEIESKYSQLKTNIEDVLSPIRITDFTVTEEAIDSLRKQIGSSLHLGVSDGLEGSGQTEGLGEELKSTLDQDVINSLSEAVKIFIDELKKSLEEASSSIGETLNTNIIDALANAVPELGRKIQEALDDISFNIGRIGIDPDALQQAQDQLNNAGRDTRISKVSSTFIGDKETSNSVTYRTGRYRTETVNTVHAADHDITVTKVTQDLEAENKALQKRNDILYDYMSRVNAIRRDAMSNGNYTDSDINKQSQNVNNAMKLFYNADDKTIHQRQRELKDAIDLYEKMIKTRKKAADAEKSEANALADTLRKAESTLNNIDAKIRTANRLDDGAEKDGLIKRYDNIRRLVNEAENEVLDDPSNTNNVQYLNTRLKELNAVLEEYNGELNSLKGNDAFERQSERAAISANNLERRVETLKKAVSDYREANTKAMKNGRFVNELNAIEDALSGNNGTLSNEAVSNLSARFAHLKREISQAGMAGKTAGEHIKAMFEKFGGWSLVTRSMTKLYSTFRQLFTAVRELDTAMVNLRKVSEGTAAEYDRFLQNATDRAQKLGTSITNLVDASAEFSRLGFNLEESAQLGELATMYSKVAEDLTASDAAQSIVSTMKAFNIEAERAVEIVDLYNYVGNNFAISSAGIGDSLQRSASSLAAANTTLQETVALTTAANEIMQDPLKVGTSLKTISARIRGAKTELDEMGESTDDLAGGTAKLKAEIQALSGVDIMESPTQFKSIYTVFDELANVWDRLTDVQQATIAEKLGGKNGLNTVYSLISNFQTARDVMGEVEDASGSASKELERSLDSIEGKLGKLSATFQEIANNLLNSGALKTILDIVNGIGQGLAAAAPFIEKLLPVLGVFGVVKGAEWGIGKIKGIGGLGEPAKHRVPYNVPRILISCA